MLGIYLESATLSDDSICKIIENHHPYYICTYGLLYISIHIVLLFISMHCRLTFVCGLSVMLERKRFMACVKKSQETHN